MVDTSEYCNYQATTVYYLCDIEIKKCWLEIDQFKAEKERELKDKAERAEREVRKAKFRTKYSKKK